MRCAFWVEVPIWHDKAMFGCQCGFPEQWRWISGNLAFTPTCCTYMFVNIRRKWQVLRLEPAQRMIFMLVNGWRYPQVELISHWVQHKSTPTRSPILRDGEAHQLSNPFWHSHVSVWSATYRVNSAVCRFESVGWVRRTWNWWCSTWLGRQKVGAGVRFTSTNSYNTDQKGVGTQRLQRRRVRITLRAR